MILELTSTQQTPTQNKMSSSSNVARKPKGKKQKKSHVLYVGTARVFTSDIDDKPTP